MPRVVKDQECIFCGDTPCSCDDRKKSPKRTKKPRRVDEPEPEAPKLVPKERERDLTMEAAIRALGPILSRHDKLTYRRILGFNLSQGIDRRLKDWRESHGMD